MDLIRVTDVQKTYKNGVVALYDFSVSVSKGDFVFVIGASGSGKSTFIKMLYREEKPDKGEIIIGGINVAKLAHLPKVVLDRASQLLSNFENQDNNQNYQPSLFVMDQVQPEKSKLLQQLQELDIDSMTPRDALDCLYELKQLSEKIEL